MDTASIEPKTVTAADVKMDPCRRGEGHTRFAYAAGRQFRITQDADARVWYDIDEVRFSDHWGLEVIAYAGQAHTLPGVADRIAEVLSKPMITAHGKTSAETDARVGASDDLQRVSR